MIDLRNKIHSPVVKVVIGTNIGVVTKLSLTVALGLESDLELDFIIEVFSRDQIIIELIE